LKKKSLLLYLTALFLIQIFSCKMHQINKTSFKDLNFTQHKLESSIRALKAVANQECWFAGNNNKFGHTKDGGQTWKIDSLVFENLKLEFRAVEKTDDALFILSVASPALLFKSKDNGANWNLVYRNNHEKVFFNALQFANSNFGIAVGDPIDACLNIIFTTDAGENWEKIDCALLPETNNDEFNFAASNTNINIQNNTVFIATGGSKARILSLEFDTSFKRLITSNIFQSPIVEGGKMTGIFSSDFQSKKNGIVAGGNWEDKNYSSKSAAVTKDGGKSWRNIPNQLPYTSCVQYVPKSKGQQILTCSTEGIYFSKDSGLSFHKISEESFYSFRFSEDGKKVYFSGKDKLAVIDF